MSVDLAALRVSPDASEPVVVHDLVLATRLDRPTGVERVALNTFAASARRAGNVIGMVADRARVAPDLPVVEVGAVAAGWLGLYWRIPAAVRARAVMVCGGFPASPSLRASRIPIARIIADDFPWTRAAQMAWKGRLLFRHYEDWMLSRYDLILTISEDARQRLRQTLGREDVRFAGCASGLADGLAGEPPAGLGGRPVLLMVGTVEPRKNYEALERLLPALAGHWQVVVAGRPGWQGSVSTLEVLERQHPRDLLWLRDAGDRQLRWLYDHAAAFASLSHAEGFNMPLVEAGSAGLPVICSDLPVHRDVAPPWSAFVPAEVDADRFVASITAHGCPGTDAVSAYAHHHSWAAVADRVEAPLTALWRKRRAPG